MSRGLGKVQQDILDTLTNAGDNWTTNTQLAQQLGKSPRQTLNALSALVRRGLIETRRNWRGTSARTLNDDGTPRPEALTDTLARKREEVWQAEKAIYFAAMDEVISSRMTFTAWDVHKVVETKRAKDDRLRTHHGRMMSGVFATYLRKHRIMKVGTEKSITDQPVNRYAPVGTWWIK